MKVGLAPGGNSAMLIRVYHKRKSVIKFIHVLKITAFGYREMGKKRFMNFRVEVKKCSTVL